VEGVLYIDDFLSSSNELYSYLERDVNWDTRMASRKTASFGRAYNYSQIEYPYLDFPNKLEAIIDKIEKELFYRPNNCLINFYQNGNSKMGFHSDQTDILQADTGIIIISLGETRILRFREIRNKENIVDYELPSGSLIEMSSEMQYKWQHSIPKKETLNGRMSLTFRKLKD